MRAIIRCGTLLGLLVLSVACSDPPLPSAPTPVPSPVVPAPPPPPVTVPPLEGPSNLYVFSHPLEHPVQVYTTNSTYPALTWEGTSFAEVPRMGSGRIAVGLFIASFDAGGTEGQMLELATRLDPRRFHVRLACFSSKGPWASRARNQLPVAEFPLESLSHPRTAAALLRFAAWCRRHELSVVHTAGLYANIFGLTGAALARVPLRVASRRCLADVAHSPARRRLERLTYRLAHRVVTNSSAAGRLLAREGVAPDAIAMIPNGIDIAGRPVCVGGRKARGHRRREPSTRERSRRAPRRRTPCARDATRRGVQNRGRRTAATTDRGRGAAPRDRASLRVPGLPVRRRRSARRSWSLRPAVEDRGPSQRVDGGDGGGPADRGDRGWRRARSDRGAADRAPRSARRRTRARGGDAVRSRRSGARVRAGRGCSCRGVGLHHRANGGELRTSVPGRAGKQRVQTFQRRAITTTSDTRPDPTSAHP